MAKRRARPFGWEDVLSATAHEAGRMAAQMFEDMLRDGLGPGPGGRPGARRVTPARLAAATVYQVPFPFRVLGVLPDAPRVVVEAAYRALSKDLHPDTGGDTERMTELNAAVAAVRKLRGWA